MTTAEKQNYLYKEIIESDLDPEEFQLFLESKKPENGLDITLWKFDDLKQVVQEFKSKAAGSSSPTKKQEPSNVSTSLPENKPAEEIKQKQEQKPGFGQRVPIKPPTKKQTKEESKSEHKKQDGSKQSQKISQSPKQAQLDKPKSQNLQSQAKSGTVPPKKHATENKQKDQQPIGSEQQYSNYEPTTKQEIFSRSVNCGRAEVSMLFNLDVKAEIKKYETVEGSLFQQTYVIYTVNTPSQGWSVTRRYNDFVWLRENLEKMHPGLPIPPIPKKSSYRKFQEKHLRKRMKLLESFLNKVLTVPELKGQEIVMNFLKISDNIEYLKFKKAATVEESQLKLDKLKTLKGKLNLVIQPKITKLLNMSRQNFAFSEPRLTKIYKQGKVVSRLMNQSAGTVMSMSKTFEELSEESNHFNKKSELQIKSSLSYLYDIMKGLTNKLAKIIAQEGELLNQYFYYIYKYEATHVTSIQQSMRKIDEAEQEYRHYRAKLRRTKEKLLEQHNYAKWGMSTAQTEKVVHSKDKYTKEELINMMLPKETDVEIQLKQYYALLNFQSYQEISRYMHQNPKFLASTLLDLIKKESQISSHNMMLWADTMANVMSFQEGKRVCEMEMDSKK